MSTKDSPQIADMVANPPVLVDAALHQGELRIAMGTIALGLADLVDDNLVRLTRLPAKAKIVRIFLASDGLGAAGVSDLGIHDVNGAVKKVDFFVDNVNFGIAKVMFASEYRFGGDGANDGADINTMGQELWQNAGYVVANSVPGGLLDVVLRLQAFVSPVAGDLSYIIEYVLL